MSNSNCNQSIYHELRPENDEIRLLRLEPEGTEPRIISSSLQHWLQTEAPSYVALSYCWGIDSRKVSIRINGTPVSITGSLYEALLHMRSHGHTTIWADALCINQENPREKALQIVRMGSIYRTAQEVAIWVGLDADGSDEVMDVFNRITVDQTSSVVSEYSTNDFLFLQLPITREFVVSLSCFFRRDYWERLWIAQEIVLAIHARIYCGKKVTSWANMANFVDETLEVLTYRPTPLNYELINDPLRDLRYHFKKHDLQNVNNLINLRKRLSNDDRPNLIQALVMMHNAKATVPRDRIFGLTGFSMDGTLLVTVASYQCTLADIHQHLTVNYITSKRSLDIICFEHLQGLEAIGKPSWVADWLKIGSMHNGSTFLRHLKKISGQSIEGLSVNASKGIKFNVPGLSQKSSVLKVEGHKLAVIQHLGWSAKECQPPNEIGYFAWTTDTGKSLSAISDYNFDIIHPPNLTSQSDNALSDQSPYGSAKETARAVMESFAALSTSLSVEEKSRLSLYDFFRANLNPKMHPRSSFFHWIRAHMTFNFQGMPLIEWALLSDELRCGRLLAHLPLRIRALPFILNSDHESRWLRYCEDMEEEIMSDDWCLLTTFDGRIGWAHYFSDKREPTDQIYLLAGCSIPVILRKANNGDLDKNRFQVVGCAYVHGVMDGSAWTPSLVTTMYLI
jgi:hypothetical protein